MTNKHLELNPRALAFTEKWRPRLNQYLRHRLAQDVSHKRLHEAMAYSLLAGGKRLRPLLYLAAVSSLTAIDPKTDLAIAGAIELIQTYSLIHDDLPAMDNDDYRRGQLTNHKQFDEATAILAGDGLLTLAFDWLGRAPVEPSLRGQLCATLAHASGPAGMVAGQMIDIQSTGQKLSDLTQIQHLDALKTGALLTAALDLASVRLQLSTSQADALHNFGRHFGIAFQIEDDLQDLQGNSHHLGKQVHKDVAAGKNTYPRLLGISRAKQVLQQEIVRAKESLQSFQPQVDWQNLNAYLSCFNEG